MREDKKTLRAMCKIAHHYEEEYNDLLGIHIVTLLDEDNDEITSFVYKDNFDRSTKEYIQSQLRTIKERNIASGEHVDGRA